LKYFLAFALACIWIKGTATSLQESDTINSKEIVELVYKDMYAEAIQKLEDIKEEFKNRPPTREYIKLLIQVSEAFNEKGNYEATQQYSFTALALATQAEMKDLQAEVLVDIGYSYYFLNQLEKGIEYGEKALQLAHAQGLENIEGTVNNLLGILHSKSGHSSELIMGYYKESLAIRKKIKDARGIAATLSNIALQLERDNKWEEALVMQKYSLAIDDSLQNEYGTSWSYQMIGELLIKMKRYDEANVNLNKAESLAHKLQAREVLLQTYKTRSKYLAQQKRFEEALKYSDLYNSLRDSIYNAGLTSKVTLFQQSFEMRDRDRQIVKQQASLEVQRKFFIVLTLAISFVMVLLFFYYRSYKKTLSLNREITEQNEEIQTQSEELTEANQALQTLNTQIAEQKEELQAQAEELTESNQTILSLNEQLNSDIEIKNQELIKTNEELVRHNNELLQFSFTVSHNLRGPVARMLGLMNLIDMTHSPGEKEQLIGLLKRSTLELDTILSDLTLIVDSRSNLFKVREKILFQEEWSKCVILLQEYIKPEFIITADFTGQPYVFSVRAMIQSVLYNLLSNAIKYRSPERGLEVTVTTHHNGNETILIIRDNGLGIDLSSHQSNVFKLYRRFHTHVTGKGLGLYLVKTQMDTLGGTIDVQSELNRGTTFSATFPDAVNIDAQVFFENDAARLCFDANINNTIIEWKRSISSREYHEVFESVLQTLRTYNTPAWIADLRSQGAVNEVDQKWFMSTVLPQAVMCGLKRIGTIGFLDPIREDYYKKMQVKTHEMGIELQVFSTMEDAKAWMSACLVDSGSFQEPV